jgi:hypothetical protein
MVHQVDGLFRGVFISAGEHEIAFRFRPRSFGVGAAVSVAGLGLVGLLLGWAVLAARRDATNGQ